MYQVTITLNPPDREPIIETINVDSLQIAGYREASAKGLFDEYHERKLPVTKVRPIARRSASPSEKGTLNGASQGFSLMR